VRHVGVHLGLDREFVVTGSMRVNTDPNNRCDARHRQAEDVAGRCFLDVPKVD
jgi:hypothetical protein